MIEKGKKAKLSFTFKIDGESSKARAQEVEYIHGEGKIIPKLEAGLEGLSIGDSKTIKISPQEGHGLRDPKKIQEVPKTPLSKGEEPKVGQILDLQYKNSGKKMSAKVLEVKEETIVLDLNHPLAGKEVEFNVEVLSIEG